MYPQVPVCVLSTKRVVVSKQPVVVLLSLSDPDRTRMVDVCDLIDICIALQDTSGCRELLCSF